MFFISRSLRQGQRQSKNDINKDNISKSRIRLRIVIVDQHNTRNYLVWSTHLAAKTNTHFYVLSKMHLAGSLVKPNQIVQKRG